MVGSWRKEGIRIGLTHLQIFGPQIACTAAGLRGDLFHAERGSQERGADSEKTATAIVSKSIVLVISHLSISSNSRRTVRNSTLGDRVLPANCKKERGIQ